MSHVEKVKGLANRLPRKELLETEEATKNALVMPFLAALGYDVFNPEEVVPEFVADVGVKKGEKVDYAIKHDGKIIMLVEAKKAGDSLDRHSGQLFRYFTVTQARIAILTNGYAYRFYTDLEAPNKMDDKPFLVVDLNDLREADLAHLGQLTKEGYDLDRVLTDANDLKYRAEIRRIFDGQFEQPDEDLVKLLFSKANPRGRFSKPAKEQFTRLVKEALQQAVTERVSSRLRQALENESEPSEGEDPTLVGSEQPRVETTEEELEAFRIVKAIVCGVVKPERVGYRDAQTYCAILLDDNNRKSICRLHFNRAKKYIGILDAEKNETRHPLDSLDGIYQHADALKETASRYAGE